MHIQGIPGIGKTHLLNALAASIGGKGISVASHPDQRGVLHRRVIMIGVATEETNGSDEFLACNDYEASLAWNGTFSTRPNGAALRVHAEVRSKFLA
jgi:hypothetical protein